MTRLSLGVVCYPTFGGSGVIASEVALGMARRGHDVHVFAYARPARLHELDGLDERESLGEGHLTFHKVEVVDYPVFHHPPYALAMASRIAEVCQRHRLDVVHVHYAVPHATSAMLARQVLMTEGHTRLPRVVTTLHGTDITLVGSDPSYRPITRASILASDALTAPSRALCEDTRRRFELEVDVEVIPNFVDLTRFSPRPRPEGAPPTLIHVSNFRAVKRVDDVISIFEMISRDLDARLVLVGDGPELAPAVRRLEALGLRQRAVLHGERHDVERLYGDGDVFLLPSSQESFGVAALEAMASGLPVVVSDVGGLPEVVEDGVTGYLCPVGDTGAFAARVGSLLKDPAGARRMGAVGREHAVARFSLDLALTRFEALYQRLVRPA